MFFLVVVSWVFYVFVFVIFVYRFGCCELLVIFDFKGLSSGPRESLDDLFPSASACGDFQAVERVSGLHGSLVFACSSSSCALSAPLNFMAWLLPV